MAGAHDFASSPPARRVQMRVLFVHQDYPAQFGHVARRLVSDLGWRCDFVSQLPAGEDGGVRLIQYRPAGGATAATHHCSRTFENAVWHAHAVYEACARRLGDAPDLVVGHSGLGSTFFLRELFDCPVVNYFEYFYHARASDLDFRPEFPPAPSDRLRARARNAVFLLDLDNCDAGYCPTEWQRGRFPAEYRPKLEVIFDGIDTRLWRRRPGVPRRIGDRVIAPGTRVVTYVARGLEAMRGFDIFMRVARRVYEAHPDVLFVVVGGDQIYYGPDRRFIQAESFRAHVLANGDYDPARFCFTGQIAPERLSELLSLSDLHVYLSVPFVPSWSLFDALACECVVLASDTAPVREVIRHGETGLLADFYDVDGLARQALEVLRDPPAFRPLARAGAALIDERYSLDRTLPRLAEFFRRVRAAGAGPARRD